LISDHAQNRASQVAVHGVGFIVRDGLGANGLVASDGAEHANHDGAELRGDFTLSRTRPPTEARELGFEEFADHAGERFASIVLEGAIDEADGGRDAGPGGGFVLVTESLRHGVEFGPGTVAGEECGPTVGEQGDPLKLFKFAETFGDGRQLGRGVARAKDARSSGVEYHRRSVGDVDRRITQEVPTRRGAVE
jgi:hypothetical protein